MPQTANQIVGIVTQTLKCPGFTAQAQQFLNVTLADLSDMVDLDLLRNVYTGITLTADNGSGNGSGPYLLPMDYKRAEWGGVWFLQNGQPYKLVNIELEQYFGQVQQPGIANYPYQYATDISPLAAEPPTNPLLYVWPPSSIATTLYVEYRRILPDISFGTAGGGTVVPWFPNQNYLRLKTCAMLADLVDDSRAAEFEKRAEAVLNSFMMLANDDEPRAKTMKLDRRSFGNNWDSLQNTKTLGW